MNNKMRTIIRNKARLACGLANILEYDINNLMNDANECYLDELFETVQATKETLQNLVDTITEIEYALYLDKVKESS